MKVLFIFGTRPEAIKLAPLVHEFLKHKADCEVKVCVTAQHREMLDQVLHFFRLKPDFDLNIMKKNQTLFDVTASSLLGLEKVLNAWPPDFVIVQGDTTTAFVGALAAYYKNIRIVHIEAGLRSGNKFSPYPEEINRILTGHMTDYHFAPTARARANLEQENIKENVWVVGNTVIDALFMALSLLAQSRDEELYKQEFAFLRDYRKTILVTGHRRESFGRAFEDICHAIRTVAEQRQDVCFVYPVHLNPQVRTPVNTILQGLKNVRLIEPLDYPRLIWLMRESFFILTDSGGIQEEAPSLGKPVLVMREVTERTEGIEAGTARLVGTNKEVIIAAMLELLEGGSSYQKMSMAGNPYGDGQASSKIVQQLLAVYRHS